MAHQSISPIPFSAFVNKIRHVLLFLFVLSALGLHAQVSPTDAHNKDSIVQLYNDKALKLLNEGRYEECIQLANTAIKIEENPVSYCLLCHIYNIEKKYTEAIKYGELAVKANPNFLQTYAELFNSYYSSNHWKEAMEIIERSEDMHVSGFSPEQKKMVENEIESENFSHKIILIFLAVLAGFFFIPIYNASKSKENYFSNNTPRMSEAIVVSGLVSCFLYLLFFASSEWIWSFNLHFPVSAYTTNMRVSIFEHDGIESYVLYIMMLANIVLTLLITSLLLKIKHKTNLYIFIILSLLLLTGYYFYQIGFHPPMQDIDSDSFLISIILLLISIGLYILYLKNSLLSRITVVALISFAGLISAGPASLFDLMYILSPALRMIHGFKISEIYFQYDLFLSFLAMAWMKMNFALEWFPYLGQVSFFLFFIAIFFFADGFFKTKGLAVVFILAVIIIRFYGVSSDIPTIMQTTPIRLDLWIILLLVAWKKGIHHWTLGFFIGLLVLFHRNLGIVYLASYFELITALFLLDIIILAKEKRLNIGSFVLIFKNHVRLNLANLCIIISSIALCFILFHEMFSKSALIYSQVGITMSQISRISFYWYVPVYVSSLVVFLFYYREILGKKYTTIALFIVFLLIGNSIYFFGRSHENNILNASAILVLSLFMLIDVVISLSSETPVLLFKNTIAKAQIQKPGNKKEKKHGIDKTEIPPASNSFPVTWKKIAIFFPFLFIAFVSYYYSERIYSKSKTQFANLGKLQVSYPFSPIPVDTTTEKKITNNSSKVYFLDYYFDFYHYYYGHYAPQGFFNPCATWVFKKDVINFLQDLINKGYYIVYSEGDFGYFGPYFLDLSYNQSFQIKNFVAISKQDVPLIISETLPSVYHVGIKDSLAHVGLEHPGYKLKDEFTIEIIMKPIGNQASGGVILNNLSKTDGLKGFTIQKNGTGDQYGFGFSNGTPTLTSTFFLLETNKWHYLIIVVNKEHLSVYDNGKMVANVNTGGLPYQNSDIPLTIGNQATKDSYFSGYIREVNISNGNINETEIIKKSASVATSVK